MSAKKRNSSRRSRRKFKASLFTGLLLALLLFLGIYRFIIYDSNPTSSGSLANNTLNNDKLLSKDAAPENKPQEPLNNESPNKNTQTEHTNTEVLLSAVGDCTLGRDEKYSYEGSLPHVLEKNNKDYSYFFENVKSILGNDDISIANFEGTLTNSSIKADKQFTFKAPPEYAKILYLGSIEAVNLSNNHTRDYLEKGFQDTKLALEKESINYFGEGSIWIKDINGIKFGFLGYKGYYNSKELQIKIKNDIKKLKAQNSIVIINFHWGEENSYEPNSTQKSLAHFAIDNGADLIIGHHPHVLQGVEKYKNKLICYSLGNFSFGGNKNPRDKDTVIVQLKYNFENQTLKSYDFKAIPCTISSVNHLNDYKPTLAEGSKKATILNKLNNISKNLGFKLTGDFYNIPLN